MSKITFEHKRSKTVIVNKLSYPEAINERVYNTVTSGAFDGFLPMNICRKRGGETIECIADGPVPLNQYFRIAITKKRFLQLVANIGALIRVCEQNGLNTNNLDLHPNTVFIDPYSGRVKCIFWPIVNNQNGERPHLFLKQLPYGLSFDPRDGVAYLQTYKAFFDSNAPFSLDDFDAMIFSLSGDHPQKKNVPPKKQPTAGSVVERKSNVAIEYDPFSAVGDSRASAVEYNMRDATYDFCQSPTFPVLMRLKSGECHPLNKSLFRLGTDRGCDLVMDDNSYVSRYHADIVVRENRYYIIDRHSTNKTFVNGYPVFPEQETEIFIGDTIRVANEELYFTLSK